MEARNKLFLVVFSIIAIAIPLGAQPVTNYVIGPQDVLTITSFDQEDLSGKYQVDADGTFSFPLIGRVQAGGLTLRQVQAELEKRLKEGFFKNPQLGVAEPITGLLDAVGYRLAFEPPFAKEGSAALFDLGRRGGVDHIVVVNRDLVVQPRGRVGQ